MITWLQSWTALPNFHPALVHFPIAFFVLAFLFDLGTLVFRRRIWLDRSATALYVFGCVGGVAAFFAGRQAADLLGDTTSTIATAINAHSDWALWTLIFFGVLTVCRLTLT